jgi:hypothetical protein
MSSNRTGLVLMFRGVPGLGKTTVGEALAAALRDLGFSTVTLEQDQFPDRKQAAQQCFDLFGRLLASDDFDVIIQQRNNANEAQYRKYEDLALQMGWKVIHLVPGDLNLVTLLTCFRSVISRRGHPTFGGLSKNERIKIASFFYSSLSGEVSPSSDFIPVMWFRPLLPDRRDDYSMVSSIIDWIVGSSDVDDTMVDAVEHVDLSLEVPRRSVKEIVDNIIEKLRERKDWLGGITEAEYEDDIAVS